MRPLIAILLLCLPLHLSSATLGPIVSLPTLYEVRLPPSWTGEASYYARRFHGRVQADGSLHDQTKLTAASLTLPLGTVATVTRVDRPWRSVVVEITDRGPYVDGRLIDLSREAARRLGMLHAGVVDVTVRSE